MWINRNKSLCLFPTTSQIIASFPFIQAFSLHSSFVICFFLPSSFSVPVVMIFHHLTSVVQNEQTDSQCLVGGKHWKYTPVIKQVWVAFVRLLSYAARLYSQMFWIVWKGWSWQGFAASVCVRECMCIKCPNALIIWVWPIFVNGTFQFPQLTDIQCLLRILTPIVIKNNEDLTNMEMWCCYFWTAAPNIQHCSGNVILG